MISYNWTIHKLQVLPKHESGTTNVVTQVHWICIATDNDSNISATSSAIKELTLGSSFVPYADLTEQQILNWCFAEQVIEIKDSNGDVQETFTVNLKQDVETQLADQIKYKIEQSAFEPTLPWVKTSTTEV